MKWIAKRLMLAVFLIPGGVYVVDLVRESGSRNECARIVCEAADWVGAWFTDRTARAYEEDIAAEEARLATAIDEADTALVSLEEAGDSAAAEEMSRYLVHLLKEREEVLELKHAHLDRLNAKRLSHEEFRLMKVRHEAAQDLWASANKVASLRAAMARQKQRAADKPRSAVVNDFLNAVQGGKPDEVRKLCLPELKARLTNDKVTALARSAPDGPFRFKAAAAGGDYDVLFDDKARLTLTLRDGKWLVAGVW